MTDQPPPSWEELWAMVEDLKQRQKKINELAEEYRRKERYNRPPSKYGQLTEKEMLAALNSSDFGKGSWERRIEEKLDYLIDAVKPGGWLDERLDAIERRIDGTNK